MKKLLLTIYILIALFSCTLYAQLRMEFNAELNNTPFKVAYGDSLKYNVFLINTDTVLSLNTAIHIGFNGSNGGIMDSLYIGNFQIPPQDTVSTIISIEVGPQYFKTGPEVVVVWPIYNGNRGEQIADFILVDGTFSSVLSLDRRNAEITLSDNQFVFTENVFRRVRILDMAGQIIAEFTPETNRYQIPQLSPAMYVLQALTSDNKSVSIKFISHH